jgi:oligopeptidase B
MSDQPSSALPVAAPIASKKEFETEHHGHKLSDPYHWLRDPNYPVVEDKEILAHLEAENAYYKAAMSPHSALTDDIYEQLVARIKQDDSSVPHKHGDYLYWWKFERGAQYRQWFRSALDGSAEESLLDEVALAEGHEYFRLGGLALSPDHRRLAWSTDTDGSERYTIRVRDLSSGVVHEDEIPGTSGSAAWAADGESFLYTLLSKEHRPYRVKLHKLGTPVSDDVEIYEEADPSFFVNIGKTSSRRFLCIMAGDHVSSEVRILPASDPLSKPVLVAPRRPGHEYYLDDSETEFLIRTNDTHKNFRVVTAPFDNPAPDQWSELIAATERHYITGLCTFKSFFTLSERIEGQQQIRIRDYEGDEHLIKFAEDSFTAGLGSNSEYDTDVLRVGYQSMVSPPSVMDYHIAERRLELLKEQEIPSGYDKAGYETERLMATSHDGAKVPISIVYAKGFKRDGSCPLHLYAYGAYGMAIPPAFSTSRLSLLDKGFAYAIAHIRGGDEMGYQWYEDGKLQKRTNTFKDFVACAEHLVDTGYASKGGISISGGSAGGTLMGAVTNMRPDLWRAVVSHVPFVDVLNTMLDDTLPLTPIEWPEWGNPIADKEAYDYILSYSPYENTSATDYPLMMVTAGLNDPRVTYWEPAKWVAKLRELKTDKNLLIYKTNMGAGHGGKSGRFEKYFEVAEEYTFLLAAFGLAG